MSPSNPSGEEADEVISKAYPEFMKLLEPLWGSVVMRDTFEEMEESASEGMKAPTLEEKLEWLDNYRYKLCAYYDAQQMGSDVSPYEKTDVVIETAEQLWNWCCENVYMGRIEAINARSAIDGFSHVKGYNKLSQLLRFCSTEEQKSLLKDEFECWTALEELFVRILTECTILYFWGGSGMSGAGCGWNHQINKPHNDMYNSERYFLKYPEESKRYYVIELELTKKLLTESCKKRLSDVFLESEESEDYKEYVKETEESISKLPNAIEKWVQSRQKWAEAINSQKHEQFSNKETSEALLKIVNVVCGW